MTEAEKREQLAHCPRCRYATEGLEGASCPECGVSVLEVRRDGYSAESVRLCVGRAVVVTGLNLIAVGVIAVFGDYFFFPLGVMACVFVQVGCFLLTMIHLPASDAVREDFEIRGWVIGGLVVNIVGFGGCAGVVALRLILDGVV